MERIRHLELLGITKSFGDVTANYNIDLDIRAGEIVGLLGENGAGKTTLMNILYGLYQPDAGEIRVNGRSVRIRSPRDSMFVGIGMVHQHFMLVENHTVSENVALGYEASPFLFPARRVKSRLAGFAETYGLEVDPEKMVWQLSAGEQQRVEIAKLLLNSADLLIMDEPTSVLTPQETTELFSVLRRMRSEGHSVVFISHKLEEVLEICDRIIVLRKGEIVGSSSIDKVDRPSLARMMVGREVIFDFRKESVQLGEVALEVSSLVVQNDRGAVAVDHVDLGVHRNEILGIAGVSGNGQKELVEALTGLRKIESGEVRVEGADITKQTARAANNMGITHVPEERMRYGIVPNLYLYDNAVLKHHNRPRFSNLFFLDYSEIRSHAEDIVEGFQIDTPSIGTQIKNLSGGNIQKLILGREISGEHTLLVASHPTYGLDVGATEFIRNHLLKRRKSGSAVLLVSEDLEELFELADRIAVMYEGSLMGVVRPEETDNAEIGLMMAGSLRKTPESADAD